VDWATVTSIAITGAVGIAGVTGTIIAAKITGDSATQGVKLSITAENDRARLADKRQIYARAMAAFSTAVAVAKEAKEAEAHTSDEKNFAAARLGAVNQVNEMMLIAPRSIAELASQAMTRLDDYWQGRRDLAIVESTGNTLFSALRTDLGTESSPPASSPDGSGTSAP
jgi:hypothetical protein